MTMATDSFTPLLFDIILIRSGLAIMLGYIIVLIFYRLYLSPLSSFPGPKIAAATSLYAMYHDIIPGGAVYLGDRWDAEPIWLVHSTAYCTLPWH